MSAKVLMVDDDEGFLLATSRLLEAGGYEVAVARSAAEAEAQLESERPDLILLDVVMPTEDGFSFAERLSKAEAFAGIPVVLVTAVAESSGQMMHAFEEGKGLTAMDVLPKSNVHERLLGAVADALAKK